MLQNQVNYSQKQIVHDILIVWLCLLWQVAGHEDNDCIETIAVIACKQKMPACYKESL